jgi:hypothetical protein
MSHKKALLIIFIMSIAGILFSGYLSYEELFTDDGCSDALVQCGEKNIEIADLPACVYGFTMFALIFLISGITLFINRKKEIKE